MLKAERFHKLLVAARDVVRVAVRIKSLKVARNTPVLLLNSFPVLCVLLGDEWGYCLTDSADPSGVRFEYS